MAHEGWHEDVSALPALTRDQHRALVSLEEELEAVDWYQQRIDASDDPELKAVLAHNRDEEKEHAAMVLEWLRRHDAALDAKLREYLFVDGSIVGREEAATGGDTPGGGAPDGSLGIGSLRARS